MESIDNTLNEVGDLLLADGKNITLQSETDKDGYAREVKIAIHGINPRHIKEISWYINGKKCTADGGSFRQYLREPGKHEIAAAVTFFNGTVVVRKAAFSVTKPVVKLSLLGKAADYAREVKFELDGFNRRYVKNISWYVNNEKCAGKSSAFNIKLSRPGKYETYAVVNFVNGDSVRSNSVEVTVKPPVAKVRLRYNNKEIAGSLALESRRSVAVTPVIVDVTPANAANEFTLYFNDKVIKSGEKVDLLPGSKGAFMLVYGNKSVDHVKYDLKKREISAMDIAIISGNHRGKSNLRIDTKVQNAVIPVEFNFAPGGEDSDDFGYDYYVYAGNSQTPQFKGRHSGRGISRHKFAPGKYFIVVQSRENSSRKWQAEFQIVYTKPIVNIPEVAMQISRNGEIAGSGKHFKTSITAGEDGKAAVELELVGESKDKAQCTVFINKKHAFNGSEGKKRCDFQLGTYTIEVKTQSKTIAAGVVEVKAPENSFELKCSSAAGDNSGARVAFDVNADKSGKANVSFVMSSRQPVKSRYYTVKINKNYIGRKELQKSWSYSFSGKNIYVVEFFYNGKSVAQATVNVKQYAKPVPAPAPKVVLPKVEPPKVEPPKPLPPKKVIPVKPAVAPAAPVLVLNVAAGDQNGKINVSNTQVAGTLKMSDIYVTVANGDVAAFKVKLTAAGNLKYSEKYSVTLVKVNDEDGEASAAPAAAEKAEVLDSAKAFTRELDAGKYELSVTIGKKTVKCTIIVEAEELAAPPSSSLPYVLIGVVLVAGALVAVMVFVFGQRKFVITIGEKSKRFNAGLHTIDQSAFLECSQSFKVELLAQKSGDSNVFSVIFHIADGSVEHNDSYVTVTDGKSEEIVIAGKEDFKISKFNNSVEVCIETK